jgi:hypothetical protein
VRGTILRPAVGFYLDHPPPTDVAVRLAHHELAEQIVSDVEGVTVEELGPEQAASGTFPINRHGVKYM